MCVNNKCLVDVQCVGTKCCVLGFVISWTEGSRSSNIEFVSQHSSPDRCGLWICGLVFQSPMFQSQLLCPTETVYLLWHGLGLDAGSGAGRWWYSQLATLVGHHSHQTFCMSTLLHVCLCPHPVHVATGVCRSCSLQDGCIVEDCTTCFFVPLTSWSQAW